VPVLAQTYPAAQPPANQVPAKPETKTQELTPKTKDAKFVATGENIAEASIVIYGGLGGRKTLDQIRKTAIERGKMNLVNAQGRTEPVNYVLHTVRGDNLDSEKIRIDQEYPSINYSLVRADDKTFGLYNDTVFSPREDATRLFEDRIFHGLEALLRYKENGSTLDLAGHEKFMGVDYYFVDVTDKAGRKTRFYVSARTYRVMIIDYEEGGVKYRRKFYDYNYAQGTLVPFRTTLTADGKLVEDTQISTVTFGQKVDDELFRSGS
jgi:phage protein U